MAYIKTGKPRGRPRKNPDTATTKTVKEFKPSKHVVKHDSSDLFKLVTEIAGRDLAEQESQALVNAARLFIKENFDPTQVFDEEFLKETVLTNRIIKKKDFEEDLDDDDDDIYIEDEENSSTWGDFDEES